jgi:HlyD family secretion protein
LACNLFKSSVGFKKVMGNRLMDVTISANKKGKRKGLILTLLGGGLLLLCMFWLYSQPSANSKVAAEQLWFDDVKQGSLTVQVSGFGILESKVQRFLTASDAAVVEEVLLRPGAVVTPESVILIMSNPVLGQAVVQAELALKTEEGELKQLKLTQEREILEASNQQVELGLDLSVFQARLEAMGQLVKDGTVTRLDFLETQAEVNKLTGRLKNSKSRLSQLKRLHQQSLQIQQEQIDEKLSLLSLANDRVKSLHVKAGIHGVLQALPGRVGERVDVGSQLAFVGGTDELIAVVQVPQRDVQGMLAEMPASIDTRGGVARGYVSRIDPVVNDGNVEVEIILTGVLPDNARPSLNVEANIELNVLDNVLYIQAPVNASQHSRLEVFKVNDEKQTAQRTWLQFGAKSGQFIEIKSGALLNERFILSDMRKFTEHLVINLN